MEITLEEALKKYESAHGPLKRFDHDIARAYSTADGTWFFISPAGVMSTCKRPEMDTLTDFVDPDLLREENQAPQVHSGPGSFPAGSGDAKD